MKPRPTIFLSGVSQEFSLFRDAIENEIEMKGCFAENQPGFPPDRGAVEAMLRRKLSDTDAVVHIVGFRFGTEPHDRPAGVPRRSYTQMEFDIARELKKPVYVFLSKDPSVRQPPAPDEQPEDEEAVCLQRAHREAVTKTNHLYYHFASQAELCKLVAEIQIIAQAGFRVDVSRIQKYAPPDLIGREREIALLNTAWLKVRRAESPRPRVLTFVALGGEGKTSLVAKWVAELADQNWPGCDGAFAWSFYSQGTRDQQAASSEFFFQEALGFFGDESDKTFDASGAGAFEKGQRLARLVGQRRGLLILDGLEPLQYAPASTAFPPGQLKDQGVAKLLKDLATNNQGLCVVTTRYSLPDLNAFVGKTVHEEKLIRLSRKHGVDLLQKLGVQGSERRRIPLQDADPDSEKVNEFEKLVEAVKGHALTLTLLGGFLKRAFHGDIRQRDRVKFEKADEKMDGGHAFRTMAAYEQWLLRDGGDEGRREVAVLRLMGLFDRPADAGCLAALRSESIPGLTEPLAGLADDDWEYCLSGLETAKLLTVDRDASGALVSLDAHPHLREYFARQLRKQCPDAWRAAHRRLYEHLCTTAPDKSHPTLEDLQPLYEAVAHGCQAGLHQEVCENIYRGRIMQGDLCYSERTLCAIDANLGADACFFETPWSMISSSLTTRAQVWVSKNAAFCLRASTRLTEALGLFKVSLQIAVKQKDWESAFMCANDLSELSLTLGNVAEAQVFAEQSVAYAATHGEANWIMAACTKVAGALHHAGRRDEANTSFDEAEVTQSSTDANRPLLWSQRGFLFCDLLLHASERAAWQLMLRSASGPYPQQAVSTQDSDKPKHPLADRSVATGDQSQSELTDTCHAVSQRALRTLKWSEEENWPHSIALDHLTLGRTALYGAILENSDLRVLPSDLSHFDAAVSGLRRAGAQEFIVQGLLTRAWLRYLTGVCTGPASAQEDLDEAWEIAERGPMRLHMADIHLTRARLFGSAKGEGRGMNYPWGSPAADLAAAERLINDCGYHRRDEELADAKAAILR